MTNSRSSTYSTSHQLHPLSLLAQMVSRQVSGCLTLSARAAEWRLLFSQGRLTFATSSVDGFDRLDQQLQRVESLPEAVRQEARRLFEKTDEVDAVVSRDYRALCWLVEQQHLSGQQATQVIEAIATIVIEPFLSVREGRYNLIPAAQTEGIPTFCRLDLRPIVELCQHNSRQRAAGQPTTAASIATSRLQAVSKPNAAEVGTVSGNGQLDMVDPQRPSYTVACIDDSPTVLNTIQKFLEDQSLSVVAINDPVKALMQIVRSKPDLILLDITMPNLDGYDLCALLRRHPRYKRTPIVMVTGNTGLIDRARAKLVRASGYLTKPFTQSDLLKTVFKHLPPKD
ncbi:response regulator [Leptolyngbya sp. BC1307]|uniref:response regulator n=1 Tax=Leptolyngbya sp. BC1307 TaxID=2029589 RepID=UPI000EFB6C36|nr:response regulator [Leptolyngbya sp. BC1307]